MNKQIKFSVGGELDMPIYNAVDINPQRWNGWLRPIVTIETALQIAEDIFNHDDLSDNEPYHDIHDAIKEAKENFEDTVEVGGFIIWDEVKIDTASTTHAIQRRSYEINKKRKRNIKPTNNAKLTMEKKL